MKTQLKNTKRHTIMTIKQYINNKQIHTIGSKNQNRRLLNNM